MATIMVKTFEAIEPVPFKDTGKNQTALKCLGPVPAETDPVSHNRILLKTHGIQDSRKQCLPRHAYLWGVIRFGLDYLQYKKEHNSNLATKTEPTLLSTIIF